MENSLENDLAGIVRCTDSDIWDQLKGKSIFITGGTGFFGKWLLETFVYANETLALDISVTVLTRNAIRFEKSVPHLVNRKTIRLIEGDVKDFTFPAIGNFDFVIHAATEASESLNKENPLEMMDTIVKGTRRVLEFSKHAFVKKMLFVSSGAVYGKQPAHITHITEDSSSGPDVLDTRNVYSESKRLAELMCCVYADRYGMTIPIARCFAFVGPYLNLDIHFAIGNFIRDGLAGKTIEIKGDGTPMRSYLYSADLVVWLLTILIKGESKRAYNVGSDYAVSIETLAKNVCEAFDQKITYVVRQKPDTAKVREQYVPSVERAVNELALAVNFDLQQSIKNTIIWNSKKSM